MKLHCEWTGLSGCFQQGTWFHDTRCLFLNTTETVPRKCSCFDKMPNTCGFYLSHCCHFFLLEARSEPWAKTFINFTEVVVTHELVEKGCTQSEASSPAFPLHARKVCLSVCLKAAFHTFHASWSLPLSLRLRLLRKKVQSFFGGVVHLRRGQHLNELEMWLNNSSGDTGD